MAAKNILQIYQIKSLTKCISSKRQVSRKAPLIIPVLKDESSYTLINTALAGVSPDNAGDGFTYFICNSNSVSDRLTTQ